jgi:hypothetical protein
MQPPETPITPTMLPTKGLASISHPVRDIVLPLLTLIAFSASAIGWGVTWGKVSTRVDITEKLYTEVHDKNTAQDLTLQSLKDRTHDLERDLKEDRQRFMLFDDYTRGRIQDLPYRSPPPAYQGSISPLSPLGESNGNDKKQERQAEQTELSRERRSSASYEDSTSGRPSGPWLKPSHGDRHEQLNRVSTLPHMGFRVD